MHDRRAIELVALGLPLYHGMPLASNAALVSPLHASGEARELRGSGEAAERCGSVGATECLASGKVLEVQAGREAYQRRGSGEAQERHGSLEAHELHSSGGAKEPHNMELATGMADAHHVGTDSLDDEDVFGYGGGIHSVE